MKAKTTLYADSDLATVSASVAAGSAVVLVHEGKDIEDSMRGYPKALVDQALAVNRGETEPPPLGMVSEPEAAPEAVEEKAEEAPPEDKEEPQGEDKAIKGPPEDKSEAPRRGRPPTQR